MASTALPTSLGKPKLEIKNMMAASIKHNRDQTPWCLTLCITSTPCIPELTTVVSDIRPILSPKHDPPAMAHMVRTGSPPTMWFSHKKTGAHAANVPQEVPVATDSIQDMTNATKATVFPVIPKFKATFMMAAQLQLP